MNFLNNFIEILHIICTIYMIIISENYLIILTENYSTFFKYIILDCFDCIVTFIRLQKKKIFFRIQNSIKTPNKI